MYQWVRCLHWGLKTVILGERADENLDRRICSVPFVAFVRRITYLTYTIFNTINYHLQM